MAKIDFPKKQEQRLIPKYLLEYATELQTNHPDPSAEWGSSGPEYTAGTGIDITNDTISIDDTVVATKNDIPDVSGFITDDDLSEALEDYELKSEAFSGSYNDLTDKPTIPTKTSDLDNDSGFITGVTWNDVTGKPTFATVATSGDYNDLLNKPIIPVVPTDVSAFNNDAGYITGIDSSDVITALGYTPGTSNFSGNYNDLTNKPTIPTVNNNTITITQGGVTKGSFTLNQNTNQTIDLDAGGSGGVQLQNNSMVGLVTEATDGTNKPSISISSFVGTPTTYKLNLPEKNGTVATLDDIPTVPTNISAFNNDSGYITGITDTMVTTALGYTPGTSNFSGDYDDLTDKPDLSVYALSSSLATVATTGSYDDLTNKPIIPTNYVTTDTNQNITGEKTFVGEKRIKFKQSTSSNKLGFTLYNNSSQEKGYLEYNPTDDGMYLGRYGNYRVTELGFKTSTASASHKFLVPNVTLSGNVTDYIPISVNGTKADSTGNISISIPTVPTNVSAFTNDSGYITSSALTGYQTTSNLVTSISSSSTDSQYPSAKCMYDIVGDIETLLAAI